MFPTSKSSQSQSTTLVRLEAAGITCDLCMRTPRAGERSATYELTAENHRDAGVACRLYGIDAGGHTREFGLLTIERRSAGTSFFSIPLEDDERRIYVEIVGDGVHLSAEAVQPSRVSPGLGALASRRGVAALAFVLGTLSLAGGYFAVRPSVAVLAAPKTAMPGMFTAAYVASGAASVRYRATTPDGREIAHGSLPLGSGSIAFRMPPRAGGRSVRLVVAASGPLGGAQRTASVRVIALRPSSVGMVAGPITAVTPLPVPPQAPTPIVRPAVHAQIPAAARTHAPAPHVTPVAERSATSAALGSNAVRDSALLAMDGKVLRSGRATARSTRPKPAAFVSVIVPVASSSTRRPSVLSRVALAAPVAVRSAAPVAGAEKSARAHAPAVSVASAPPGAEAAAPIAATTGATPPAGAASGGSTTADATFVADTSAGTGIGSFGYAGGWQHVASDRRGAPLASSTRSTAPGASVALSFEGSSVRLYGVLGPNGGRGSVMLDGKAYPAISFFAPQRVSRALVFRSPRLEPGIHRLVIVALEDVAPDDSPSHINIVSAAYR